MSDDFIHFAYALAPGGAARALSGSDEIAEALADPAPAWVHLQANDPRSHDWIEAHLGYLPMPVREALTAAETRPRFVRFGDGALLNLRGVNLNPGEEPEDMISLRAFADPSRVVTLTVRSLKTVDEVRGLVASDAAPGDAGELLVDLIERLSAKIAEAVGAMDRDADQFEEDVLLGRGDEIRAEISDLRAAVVDFRRFVLPHRDAVEGLAGSGLSILDRDDDLDLNEALDTLNRAAEVIHSIRERLIVLKDEVASQHADRLNRNLYVLSIVSAVFLPLGFFTGLMGINLAGMPGSDWPPAFWVFTGGLALLGAGLVGLLAGLGFVRVRRRR